MPAEYKPIDPRSRTRNVQVVRIIRIVGLLQDGYWSASSLAQKLGVSARTVRRDLAAISHGRVRLKHDGVRIAWRLADRADKKADKYVG